MARSVVKMNPYQAASELPTVIDLRKQMGFYKPVAYFVGALTARHLGRKASKLEKQLDHIVSLVDGFYGLLGERTWVLHSSLKTSLIEEMVDDGLSPEQAERKLIEHYQDVDNFEFYVRRVSHRRDMTCWRELIERSKDDYLAGRYDATVLRIITVLDGFVNEFDKSQRCGLTSRDPGEMVGFDCLGGHYLGLSHAVEVFGKTFHKPVDDEVFEVYRNGIVHGLVVNYDNDVVASKAWNYLFAVCDWADSFEKKRRMEEKPQKSLAESIRDWREAKRVGKRLKSWKAYMDDTNDDGSAAEPWATTAEFLEAIQRGNVGHVAEMLCWPGDRVGDYIAMAKDYIAIGLYDFRILRVDHPTAARAVAFFEVTQKDRSWETSLRWEKVDESGSPAAEFENGRWVLAPIWQRLDEVENA